MSLALDSRYCGSVYVVRCGGRIVYGEESKLLDETLQRGLREFTRVVVTFGTHAIGEATCAWLLPVPS